MKKPKPKFKPNPKIDGIFRRWNKADSPGFALAVSAAGKTIYSRGYGMADLDHNIPITPATVFHAASLSKQFTAMCIMLLVERKKLALSDHVHKLVPELAKVGSPITIADMLHHVSGIRDQWELVTMAGWRLSDDVVTENDVLDLVKRMKTLNFHPGSRFSYSNTNYTLAGLIVARLSGQLLSDFARKHIFAPLRMHSTTIINTHGEIIDNRAYGYRAVGKAFEIRMPNYDLTGPTNLQTTVEDLSRWARNFDTGTVGGKAALDQMQTPVKNSEGYGLGLILGSYKGLATVEHSGEDAGYRSHFIRFPEAQVAIALLGNVLLLDIDTADLVRKVADVYLKPKRAASRQSPAETAAQEPATVSAAASAPADLEPYEGRYYSDEIDTVYEVVREHASLQIRRKKYDPCPLRPMGDDKFALDNFSNVLTSATVQFTRDPHRKIDGFRFDDATPAPNNRLADFRFTRLP